ncbi:MAG: hypothetical protein KGY80_03645 [Candidatus Thorarchaeota archaeon]|nr:hypothetical protein [Candidatus Thorarchaeota archaeon]
MNEESMEGEPAGTSHRKRIGKGIFWLGVLLVIATVLAPFVVSALAYTGRDVQLGFYEIFLTPLLIFGIIMVIIGIVLVLFPGFSKDGLWIMMTGPFGKTT